LEKGSRLLGGGGTATGMHAATEGGLIKLNENERNSVDKKGERSCVIRITIPPRMEKVDKREKKYIVQRRSRRSLRAG